jgi:hypothetical protein
MGIPPAEDRCGACEIPEALGGRVDQGRDDAQIEMGHHECRGDKDDSDGDRRRLPFTDLHED